METWKECPIHPRYEVSTYGSVRRKGKERPLKAWKMTSNKGYLMVGLGRKVRCTIHRLVAATYLGLDISDRVVIVCHKDDDPLNNRLENLYLGDKSTNQNDWNRMRRARGERHPNCTHGRYVGERRRRRSQVSEAVGVSTDLQECA